MAGSVRKFFQVHERGMFNGNNGGPWRPIRRTLSQMLNKLLNPSRDSFLVDPTIEK